jgi:hypothetical protein
VQRTRRTHATRPRSACRTPAVRPSPPPPPPSAAARTAAGTRRRPPPLPPARTCPAEHSDAGLLGSVVWYQPPVPVPDRLYPKEGLNRQTFSGQSRIYCAKAVVLPSQAGSTTACTDTPQQTGAHHPISPGGGNVANSVLTSHNKPVPTTPYSPGGGTRTHSVLTSHNKPVPTTPYSTSTHRVRTCVLSPNLRWKLPCSASAVRLHAPDASPRAHRSSHASCARRMGTIQVNSRGSCTN